MFGNSSFDSGIPDGLIILDIDQRVTYWSDGASDLLGIEIQAAIGRPLAQVLSENLPEFSPPEFLDDLVKALGDPGTRPNEVKGVITGHNPIALKLEIFGSTMSRFQHSTALLLQNLTEVTDAERQREILVQVLSHALLEHITAVIGWADLLRREDNLSEIVREGSQIIFSRGKQLEKVTRDLIDQISQVGIARMDLEDIKVDIQPQDLANILQPTALLFFRSNSSHLLQLEINQDLPAVMADSNMLKQILENLLGNAVKYSPAGSRIVISARHESGSDKVIVAVTDEGEAPSANGLDLVYVPFRKAQTTGTEAFVGGIDLGLYTVNRVVERMQGQLWVNNGPSAGATFYFSLPVAPS